MGAQRIALVGGLSQAIRPHLPGELEAALRKPVFDATDGAILLAGGALPDSPNPGEDHDPRRGAARHALSLGLRHPEA